MKRFKSQSVQDNIIDYAKLYRNWQNRPPRVERHFECVTPMWDNSARRYRGATIVTGSTPERYEQWLREAVDTAKAHEAASALALRAAFIEFVDRLDPAELEARFERAAKRGKLRGDGRAGYWDLYAQFYRGLIEMPADHLPHTYVEAFARAYKDALKKPPAE